MDTHALFPRHPRWVSLSPPRDTVTWGGGGEAMTRAGDPPSATSRDALPRGCCSHGWHWRCCPTAPSPGGCTVLPGWQRSCHRAGTWLWVPRILWLRGGGQSVQGGLFTCAVALRRRRQHVRGWSSLGTVQPKAASPLPPLALMPRCWAPLKEWGEALLPTKPISQHSRLHHACMLPLTGSGQPRSRAGRSGGSVLAAPGI